MFALLVLIVAMIVALAVTSGWWCVSILVGLPLPDHDHQLALAGLAILIVCAMGFAVFIWAETRS